ncbi:ATP-binding protein [Streptosporangium sp. NPDC048865]|uniref:ATP-binding protein n=1 Tax=Streptosporangium sp. NPDC048865 TaxID=3155766 RepID=UPI00342E758C
MMRTAGVLGEIALPGLDSSVALAREYVRGLSVVAGHPASEEITALVSELVANAVQHSESGQAGGMVRLVVSDHVDSLRVAVLDGGSSGDLPPIPVQVDPLSERGRGLWLVRELSSAWGWNRLEAGRVVWFEVKG